MPGVPTRMAIGDRSTISTLAPRSSAAIAALTAALPPPTTTRSQVAAAQAGSGESGAAEGETFLNT